MAVIVKSIGLKGLEGYTVHVEVQMIPGMETMSIVGLPDTSVGVERPRLRTYPRSNGSLIKPVSSAYGGRCRNE